MTAAAAELAAALALLPPLGDASGAVIRRHFRRPLDVVDKADASPVTIADRDAEAAIRQAIARRFPGHGVIGEEYGSDRPEAEFVWVIDPIDGTKSFISGVPLFGTLIGLLHEGRPVAGMLDQPILGERWIGGGGEASTFNGGPIHTRRCAALGSAILFTTAPELFDGPDADRFGAVRQRAKLVRYGLDCYAYGLVALGTVDLVIEAGLKLHDFAALIPIIEGAGGAVVDWTGAIPGTTTSSLVACGDRQLLDEVLPLLG